MALLLAFLVITLLMAWRIVVPAFSISFFDKPDVIQTLSAGWANQSFVLVVMILEYMEVFRREIITPLANDCNHS